MDEILCDAFDRYYHALGKMGYMAHSHAEKLLVLSFYRDFVFNDYRGLLSKEDYHQIECALECLFGSTCLIPYPDYLKMGNLNLGSISELATRIKALEETNVVKVIEDLDAAEGTLDSDVLIIAEE